MELLQIALACAYALALRACFQRMYQVDGTEEATLVDPPGA
jgi:hypothetical protein